jgi:NADPH-dependent glutamate synthase beta subunit-like oxidoreductase/Pyruvate/2-oxoacid:ferredoxin oxidoreductase delta subunit/ferredoxin
VGKVKLWVDGTQIEAEEGQSVLNAALAADIYIPHICSHPDLEAQGGCKLCVVEIDGKDGPVCSCMTDVQDGMKVRTKSETLDAIRRTSMQVMMASHPQCTGCRSFGNCEFQALQQYLSSVNHPGMREFHKETVNLNTNNPLIDRDMVRCIQCGRCVRVCADVREVEVLRYNRVDETGETYVGTLNDLSLPEADCRFCGACVEVCPTGALQDREGIFRTDAPREQALIPCSLECPAHINIPNYLRMIAAGEYDKAVGVIREKVPFPHALGYVCTHYCEKGCKRKGLNEPLAIRDLKRFAVEHDTKESWKEKAYHLPATGKKVAVVGAGPCGMTAAYYLGKKGHDVTVFERNPVAGGMLAVGIPSYRMPRADLQKEIDTIVSEAGITMKYNSDIKNVTDLKKDYDAVLVSVGASEGKVIPTKNMVAEQNTTALKFLKAVALGEIENFQPHIGKGTRVLVFGGGNVAFDAARTSARLGAQVSVVCLESREKMLADDEEIEQAQEEGVKVYSGYTNSGFNVENGKATGLNVVAVSSFKFGPNGLEVDIIPGTEEVVPCDVVVFASGQKTDLTADFGLELNRFGFPIDPATGSSGNKTSVEGVFTAGDVITGTKAVIDAIAGGRKAAEVMDAYLGGDGNIEEHLADLPDADPHIGKIEGFANFGRIKPEILSCADRCDNFNRVDNSFSEDMAKYEAARCLKCPLRCQLHKPKMWTAYVK